MLLSFCRPTQKTAPELQSPASPSSTTLTGSSLPREHYAAIVYNERTTSSKSSLIVAQELLRFHVSKNDGKITGSEVEAQLSLPDILPTLAPLFSHISLSLETPLYLSFSPPNFQWSCCILEEASSAFFHSSCCTIFRYLVVPQWRL